MKKTTIVKMLTSVVTLAAVVTVAEIAQADTNVLRLYNPHSGEHFWTESQAEKNSLTKAGWNYEGVAYVLTSQKSRTPIYRLYNKKTGFHMYTDLLYERNVMIKTGWHYEDIFGYSAGQVPVYRLGKGNVHMFTTSVAERNSLEKAKWHYDGIAFYSEIPHHSWNYNNTFSTYSGQKDVNYLQFEYIGANGSLQKGYQNNNQHAAYNNQVYNVNLQLLQDAKNADYQNWQVRQAWTGKLNQYNQGLNADQSALDSAKGQQKQYQTLVVNCKIRLAT